MKILERTAFASSATSAQAFYYKYNKKSSLSLLASVNTKICTGYAIAVGEAYNLAKVINHSVALY